MSSTRKRRAACLFALMCASVLLAQQRTSSCADCAEWNQAQSPFRIFGNTYYVGTHGLSSVLITSPGGHVLIDGDLPESAPRIAGNIKSLGFRLNDVKLIVNSHVHSDHAGGIAELQQQSGARVAASPWSAEVLRNGGVGRGDPQRGTITGIARVKKVTTLHDGERFQVGDTTITAHFTAGHTPGGTSWTWRSCEANQCRDMVYADSLNPISAPGFKFTGNREYPQALADFEKSFKFFETTPCDILITAHPEFSGVLDRVPRQERDVRPDPIIDTGACRRYAESGRAKLRERLAVEAKK
jgi:metallo-beta-lactamase class B